MGPLMQQFKKVLILSPHTDDGEIGAGGLIAKLLEQGAEIHYIAYSICEESVPEGFHKDVLAEEVMSATSVLGIPAENVSCFRFQVRYFTRDRQEILESMIRSRNVIRPDLVLLPSKHDCHQDHEVIHNEGVRAFKNVTLLGYETTWNNFAFDANLLVKLDERFIDKKIDSILEYKSQLFRCYTPDMIKSLARARGLQIKTEYAEAYNIIRWIWE